MRRLTSKNLRRACNDPWDYCGLDLVCKRDCFKPEPCKIPKLVDRLAAIEDILGDEYELDCLSPCILCRFNPPSSSDGKPCSMCPAEAALRREQE